MKRINKIKSRGKSTFGVMMGVAAWLACVTLIGLSPSVRAQDNELKDETLSTAPGVHSIPGTLPPLSSSEVSPPDTKVLLQPSTPLPDYRKAAKEEEKNYSMTLVDRLEYAPRGADSEIRWEVERWQGGDYHRWWFKSEGERSIEGNNFDADFQLLRSKLIHPFTDFQYGLRLQTRRHDGSSATRPQAVAGFHALMPYNYELETAFYLDPHGQVSASLKATKDLYITQKLVLQPRVESAFALQDSKRFGEGRGFNQLDLGLRLRYEIRREFAPYIGVDYTRLFGKTATYALRDGESARQWRFVTGVQMWF